VFDIIYQSLILVFIIGLGYATKSIGLFSKDNDFTTLSNIILYITLPSVIITNLNGLRFPPILLIISLFGFFCNWLYVFIGKYFGETREEQSFMALNINGYNIGNFALPFIAFFLEGIPILAISLFDAGSAMMVLGGNYAMAQNFQKEDSRFSITELLRTMIKQPTIIVYIIMVLLSLFSINLPMFVTDVTEIVGGANSFLAMFLIGLALEFNFEIDSLKNIFKHILLRYVPAFLLVGIIFLIPIIPTEIQFTLALILFAPIAGSVPIFTELLDGDVKLSAQINSASIIISLLIMSSFLIYLGV